MKKITLSILLLVATFFSAFAQVPNAFNYQAVVRNTSGEVVANKKVAFRISILQNSESGSVAYTETHTATTNAFGLANLKIGQGSVISGAFKPSDWGNALHFMKIEIDPNGGTSYTHIGTTQLLSVPYAFHAQTVAEDKVDDADADPSNELQTISLSGSQLTLSDGGTVTLPSASEGDKWGTQIVETDETLTGDGTNANPLSVKGELTDNQTLSLSGNDLTISGGNTVVLPAAGTSLWNQNGNNISYSSGFIGIGTTSPMHRIDVITGSGKTDVASIRLKSYTSNANLLIDKGYSFLHAQIIYSTSGVAKFYTGLIGNNTYQITSSLDSLHGLQVLGDGNVNLSDNLDIGGTLKIAGGSPAAGKVLTSDVTGLASWQTPAGNLLSQNGNNIYYNTGNIGIGTTTPINKLDISPASNNATLRLKSNIDALLTIDKGNTNQFAEIVYESNGVKKFYTGLMGNDNYRISTVSSSLNGIEVERDGDVNISDELHSTKTGDANMLPIAYGTITLSGDIYASSGNISVVHDNNGAYKITIANEHYNAIDYLTCATLFRNYSPGFITQAPGSSNDLAIQTLDTSGKAADLGFSFVVYKP